MALDTYTELVEQLELYLDRDDLTDQIPSFIALAEEKHRDDVRLRCMLKRENLAVNARYVDLPDRFLESKLLRLLTSPVTVLDELSPHELNRRRQETTGRPLYFTVHEQLEFDRSPDTQYTGEVIFYQAPRPLSAQVKTNEILKNKPSLYLYGALLEAEPFLQNDERLGLWATLYEQSKERGNAAAIRKQRGGPLISRVTGSTP